MTERRAASTRALRQRLHALSQSVAGQPTAAPSIKSELEELVRHGLSLPYVSESCHDQIRTGNHYQSVALGGAHTAGFRTTRTRFLDMIDFRGQRVLDLGSNLGEISREARARGAELVDGFEYDPFFVELAQAINAVNGVSRVSFYERDITDASSYVEEYDIVLGFSVFIYMQSVLDRIAEVTSRLLVVETHKLTGNLEQTYLEPLSRHFPYHAILGESEWGAQHGVDDVRTVLALAKTRSDLVGSLLRPVTVKTSANGGRAHSERDTTIDPRRTEWYDRFFSMFPASSREELLDGIGRIAADIDALALCSDLVSQVMGGWAYWLLYVKGCLEYREAGAATEDNVYVRYMRGSYSLGNHDAALVAQLRSPDALELLSRRFEDFETIMAGGEVRPVTLVVREDPPANAKIVYESETGAPIAAALVDGYHRLFAARLAGYSTLPARVVFEATRELPYVSGEVDDLQILGDVVTLSGWIADGPEAADGVELWFSDVLLAKAGTTDECRRAEGDEVRGAAFTVSVRLRDAERRAAGLRVVATRGWTPVGEFSIGRTP